MCVYLWARCGACFARSVCCIVYLSLVITGAWPPQLCDDNFVRHTQHATLVAAAATVASSIPAHNSGANRNDLSGKCG